MGGYFPIQFGALPERPHSNDEQRMLLEKSVLEYVEERAPTPVGIRDLITRFHNPDQVWGAIHVYASKLRFLSDKLVRSNGNQ